MGRTTEAATSPNPNTAHRRVILPAKFCIIDKLFASLFIVRKSNLNLPLAGALRLSGPVRILQTRDHTDV